MKLVQFEREGVTANGVIRGRDVYAVDGSVYGEFQVGAFVGRASELNLVAPVCPSIVVGIGANYLEHVLDVGYEIPQDPVVFLKPASTVIGHGQDISYPKITRDVQFAGELAVVIKHCAKQVKEKDALLHVLGYTCAIDITAVDLMNPMTQTLAKGMYTFCPLGPCIETDLDGDNTRLRSWLNGVPAQDTKTCDMIFGVSRIVSYVSGFMALGPGDVIITGSSRRSSIGIQPGDLIEVEIEGIGRLANGVRKFIQ